MFGWVSKLAGEVQQFGHDCVESIVGEEDDNSTSPESPKPPPQPNRGTESDQQQAPAAPRAASENDEWAPTELRFVGQQTQHLASLGWGLVERGAGIALSLLGDEQSPERQDSSALHELADQVRVAQPGETLKEEHPLEKLRACRGYLGMLRRQATGAAGAAAAAAAAGKETLSHSRRAAQQVILPAFVAELDYSDDLDAASAWVEQSILGRRLLTSRKLLTTPLDPETGERLEGEAVVAALPEFKRMAADCCDAVARMIVEELSEVFARPSRTLNSTLAELLLEKRSEQPDEDDRGVVAYWFLHRCAHHEGDARAYTLSESVAHNVMDLVRFGFCEMHRGAASLCNLSQECAAWARRTEHPRAKEIKELSMTSRGECLSANVDALVMLEEALEIVVSLFPETEGALPMEPLRVGQPLEYAYATPAAEEIDGSAPAAARTEGNPPQSSEVATPPRATQRDEEDRGDSSDPSQLHQAS